ncbi:MAG: preprotein translocase subunit SecG [Chloracidobacterium sp.]
MPWYAYALYALFVVICLLLIGVVLLQPGKGDIALFGGGSQTAFGPRGAQKPLERATFILAGLFMAVAFLFSVPGILAPRSAASGIKDTPPPKEDAPKEDKKPDENKKDAGAEGSGASGADKVNEGQNENLPIDKEKGDQGKGAARPTPANPDQPAGAKKTDSKEK